MRSETKQLISENKLGFRDKIKMKQNFKKKVDIVWVDWSKKTEEVFKEKLEQIIAIQHQLLYFGHFLGIYIFTYLFQGEREIELDLFASVSSIKEHFKVLLLN